LPRAILLDALEGNVYGLLQTVNHGTADANLSVKIIALLDSGKISGTGAAVQLEKLA